MMSRANVAAAAAALLAGAAFSADLPSYDTTQITPAQWQAYLAAVRALPGIKCGQVDDFNLACQSRNLMTDWIFTTPANLAHPALVERKSEMTAAGLKVTNRSHYAGSRRRYEQWYGSYEEWNRKGEEQFAARFAEARKYQPAERETQAVESVMLDLWAARELGQSHRTYKHLDPEMKIEVSRDEWVRRNAELHETAGPVKWRKMTSVRWYRELPGTPRPGVYSEVNVEGAFENVDAYTARLVFLQLQDGTFRLVEEEENFGPARATGSASASANRPANE